MKPLEELLQGSMGNSQCSAVPLPSPPSLGDSGSTLQGPFENHCFRQAAVTETIHPAAWVQEEKAVESQQVGDLPGHQQRSGLRSSEFLNRATLGAEAPRGLGVFTRHILSIRTFLFNDIHGLDKSRVKSCPVQLGSCSQSLI